jgi:hypothetical protein
LPAEVLPERALFTRVFSHFRAIAEPAHSSLQDEVAAPVDSGGFWCTVCRRLKLASQRHSGAAESLRGLSDPSCSRGLTPRLAEASASTHGRAPARSACPDAESLRLLGLVVRPVREQFSGATECAADRRTRSDRCAYRLSVNRRPFTARFRFVSDPMRLEVRSQRGR